MLKFTHNGKSYMAEPAKHFRLPDGTILRLVSTVEDAATVEPAKKPNSVTDYENAMEVADSAKDTEVKREPDDPAKPVDIRAAQRAGIDALKVQWEGVAKQMADLSDSRDGIESKLAVALIEYDKGRSRGTPPTPVTLGGRKMKAQRSRVAGAAPSLVPVPEVGESL